MTPLPRSLSPVHPRLILASLTILAGLARPVPVARAQESTDTRAVQPEPSRPAREQDRPLAGRIAFEYRYDDNIIQLNDRDRERFRQNPGSSRFRIDSIEDDIAIGRFDLHLRTRPIPRRVTSVALSADVYEYQRNDIKSYQEMGLALKQELTASRRRLGTIEASFARTPRFYLRQLTDDDASFEAGRRIRDELTYAHNEYGLAYDQEVVDERLSFTLTGRRARRDYNDHFNERDSIDDGWAVSARAHPLDSSILEVDAGYEQGRLRARGDLPSTPIPDDDVSYRHRAVSLDVAVAWRGRARGRVEIEVERERREFTTENQFDLSHWMREDDRRDYRLRLTQRLAGRFDASLEARRLSKHSRFLLNPGASEDETDYVENRVGLGLIWRFSL